MDRLNPLVIGLLAALCLPAVGVASHPRREAAPDAPAVFLPGMDLGRSPHVLWRSDGPERGLVLTGVQGGSLVVDEALVLRVQQATLHVLVHGAAVEDDHVQALTLEFRRAGALVGLLDLTAEAPALHLGPAQPGDSFEVGVVVTFAADTPPGTKTAVRVGAVSYLASEGEP